MCHAAGQAMTVLSSGTTRVYLGLGSNLGDRVANLQEALCCLKRGVAIDAISNLYETRPMGPADQPWYLNAVCAGWTELKPMELLAFVKEIEQRMGRVSAGRWGPRIIDIDILFYDDLVLSSSELVIPHPGVPCRAFVLEPLADIAPEFTHPDLGETISALLSRLQTGPGEVRRIAGTEEWYPCTK
jgi:2-amino-4-hydroxy-6-hydroxymethyldihydropteridine diphosphokinase